MDEQKRIITHASADCISEVETEVVWQGIITVGKHVERPSSYTSTLTEAESIRTMEG